MAARPKRHGTLIRDFWEGLIRDVLPPASVVGRHHVVMNLLKGHEGAAEMKGDQLRSSVGWHREGGTDSFIVRLLTESLIWLTAKSFYHLKRLWSEQLIALGGK